MGIIVDLILIAFLLIFIFLGYKRGLTGSLIKLISFAVAIVLAIILYKPISSAIINNTNIDENIKASIINTFSSEENNEQESQDEVQNSIVSNINKDIENATTEAKNTVVEQSAEKMSITIVNAGCAIAVFLIAKVILLVVSFFIKGITALPIIKQIDKTGGIAYGIIEGLIIIYIVFAIISFINIAWADNMVYQAIEKSALGSFLYNNNIILKFLF